MNKRRSFYGRMASQRALIGLLQIHPNTALAEMAGLCGYDFLMLDGEHGVFSETDYLHTMQAIAAADSLALIRLPNHDLQALGRYVDMGADAILVPSVSTGDQARALARAMLYPPAGTRGMGAPLHRGTRYGLDTAAHLKSPREGVCLFVIIESALGVANADDILGVEGIDGVIIGPGDLSADLGSAGDYANPKLAEAIAHIEQVASARGKWFGMPPLPGHPLKELIARGHRLFIIGSDTGLMREAMVAQVANARAHL